MQHWQQFNTSISSQTKQLKHHSFNTKEEPSLRYMHNIPPFDKIKISQQFEALN